MEKIRSQLAEIISSKICNELTSHMDYQSLRLKLLNEREIKANDLAIDYTNNMINKIKQLEGIQPEKTIQNEITSINAVQKSKQFVAGRRISIVKTRKSLANEKKLSISPRSSKRFMKGFKQNQRGLIKLTVEQEQVPSFTEYVEKLRQKKIKFAQVMQQFDQKQKAKHYRQMKSSMRQTNYTDKPFITTFTGEIIKCEKKEQNSKKDELYLQKLKIRPLFKLRQYIGTRGDAIKKAQLATETRRVSISKGVKDEQQYGKSKDDNYFIKSIIDVIANRKNMGDVRRKRHQK